MNRTVLMLALLLYALLSHAQSDALECTGTVAARHENAAVVVGDYYYLFGWRGNRPVNRLNLVTKTWDSVAAMPIGMHHFQAVVLGDKVYIAGAFTGGYPHEKPVENIWIFNTENNTWQKGAAIPTSRLRGAAGVAVYQKKIYMVAGIQDGHYDGHVTWMDEYDPGTDTWRILPDAPHARDHFQLAVVGDQFIVAGGRRSSAKTNEVFTLTERAVDVFYFSKQHWTTLPASDSIPTARAGCTTVVLHNEVWVIGGESGKQAKAHAEVEVLNSKTMKWRSHHALQTGRHGTQAAVWKKKIVIAAGSANRGGGPELSTTEMVH